MSFFQQGVRDRPGPIRGDPCVGLCHRVALSARRVLDSALCKETVEGAPLVLRDVPDDVVPTTFIEATSTSPVPVMSNLQITRMPERPTFARVRCRLTMPLGVDFLCQQGVRHTAKSDTSCDYDVVLFVPRESIFPFEIVAQCGVQSTTGNVNPQTRVATTTICVTTSLKVIAESDLLMPAYGFAPTPPGVNFHHDACKNFFELPLFPTSR